MQEKDIAKALDSLSEILAENNKEKGFLWQKEDLPKAAVLMISEIVEAVEADRAFLDEYEIKEELSDAIIRILDFCGQQGWKIGDILMKKVNYNKTRPFKHGKKY